MLRATPSKFDDLSEREDARIDGVPPDGSWEDGAGAVGGIIDGGSSRIDDGRVADRGGGDAIGESKTAQHGAGELCSFTAGECCTGIMILHFGLFERPGADGIGGHGTCGLGSS